MEFFDVIRARRSVRSYSGGEVEGEKIERILECARLAPSWCNLQGWDFVVVKEPEQIKALAKAAGMSNRWMAKAPVVIAACGEPGGSGVRSGIEYYLVDVAIAMEHLILAATDLGLGTCWIGAFNEDKVKEILGIPAKIRVVGLTPVGYPAERPGIQESITRLIARSKNRKSLQDIVHENAW